MPVATAYHNIHNLHTSLVHCQNCSQHLPVLPYLLYLHTIHLCNYLLPFAFVSLRYLLRLFPSLRTNILYNLGSYLSYIVSFPFRPFLVLSNLTSLFYQFCCQCLIYPTFFKATKKEQCFPCIAPLGFSVSNLLHIYLLP